MAASTLKTMTQAVITKEECQERLGTRSFILTDSHFCAIDLVNNATACNSDSGNGFVYENEFNGDSVLVGVTSLFTHMCRPQFPVLYTKISLYTEWILMHVNIWSI